MGIMSAIAILWLWVGVGLAYSGAKTMTDKQTVNQAFELVRKHGFIEAQRLATQWRDMNAPGTASFAMHNALCKQLHQFATVGAMYRRFIFTNGGAVAHKLIDGRVSAWWDASGNLLDCERRDGAGRMRKPNKPTIDYLKSIGASMVKDPRRDPQQTD
jgi:hypothetical protein